MSPLKYKCDYNDTSRLDRGRRIRRAFRLLSLHHPNRDSHTYSVVCIHISSYTKAANRFVGWRVLSATPFEAGNQETETVLTLISPPSPPQRLIVTFSLS